MPELRTGRHDRAPYVGVEHSSGRCYTLIYFYTLVVLGFRPPLWRNLIQTEAC